MSIAIRRALISVADKTQLAEFAQALYALKVEIISTGGTAQRLRELAIPVIEVADYTGFPELLGGRVKTLHPKIHGGILARRVLDEMELASQQIAPIDLVVVNLYPFAATIAQPNCDLETAIEQIDIGGVALIRAAAKNHAVVTVIIEPTDYESVLSEIRDSGGVGETTRQRLAVKAFAHTAQYDATVAGYLRHQYVNIKTANSEKTVFPSELTLQYRKAYDLRYGENPHQAAALYIEAKPTVSEGIIASTQRQGKVLSYNNLSDADTAWACVQRFAEPACVIVKHANPCGVAIGQTVLEAYERAFITDPISAFGGIIALNQSLDAETAAAILAKQFVEVVIAPLITEEALQQFNNKPNVRVLQLDPQPITDISWDYRSLDGGLLVQQRDYSPPAAWRVVTQRTPTESEWHDLQFAWQVVQWVKSNAIVYARAGQTLGIGAGQMSRIFAARIAAIKAADEQLDLQHAVMASDAFFPFRDGIELAAQYGIRAVIQPGGSLRDSEVIAAADAQQIAMVFTGIRHFRH